MSRTVVAKEIFNLINEEISPIIFDDNGNVGKRYRRQDEIGTPFCVTVDFDTIEKPAKPDDSGRSGGDDCVTVRDRDTGKQERIKKEDIVDYIKSRMN